MDKGTSFPPASPLLLQNLPETTRSGQDGAALASVVGKNQWGFLWVSTLLPTQSDPQEKEEETITLRPEDKINISSDRELRKRTGISWPPEEGIRDRAQGPARLLCGCNEALRRGGGLGQKKGREPGALAVRLCLVGCRTGDGGGGAYAPLLVLASSFPNPRR